MNTIDTLLKQWARWAVLKNDAGIGWPGVAAGFSDVQSSGVYGSWSVWTATSGDMKQIDGFVRALPVELRQAVIAYYQMGQTFRKAALMLSGAIGVAVDHKTIQRRVTRAQTLIANSLAALG